MHFTHLQNNAKEGSSGYREYSWYRTRHSKTASGRWLLRNHHWSWRQKTCWFIGGGHENVYSKPCVKRPLENRQKKDLNDKWLLNEGREYCRMLPLEHSAILLTCIKLLLVLKINFLSFWEWPFYTGFNVLFTLSLRGERISFIMYWYLRLLYFWRTYFLSLFLACSILSGYRKSAIFAGNQRLTNVK